MFEDEKQTCGSAACMFFMFTALYIAVLDMQVCASISRIRLSDACEPLPAPVPPRPPLPNLHCFYMRRHTTVNCCELSTDTWHTWCKYACSSIQDRPTK